MQGKKPLTIAKYEHIRHDPIQILVQQRVVEKRDSYVGTAVRLRLVSTCGSHLKFFSQRDTLRQRAPLSMESIQRMSDSACIGNATRGLVWEAVISTAIFT